MILDPTDSAPIHGAGHGQAALLLIESLIHALTAQSVLSVGQALGIVEVAFDAQTAIIAETADADAAMHEAQSLLSSILISLQADLIA